MPLIKCPECGHDVSSYADKCNYCGCPMEIITKLLSATARSSNAQSSSKFLGTIDVEAVAFINSFTQKMNEKYSGLFFTKENNKSYMYKFYDHEKLLLQFKIIKSSGALKLEYKTTRIKRRLMPQSGGVYNVNRIVTKLFPKLDEYFAQTATLIKRNEKAVQQITTQKKNEETKKKPDIIKKVNLSLSERLTTLQKQALNEITSYINNYYHDYETNFTSSYFAIRKKNEVYSLIWYCVVDNQIVLKYRLSDSLNSEMKIYDGNPFRIDQVKEFIPSILGPAAIKTDDATDDSNDLSENKRIRFSETIEANLEFYKNIKRAVKGLCIKSHNNKVVELCNSIASFVINELKQTCYNPKTGVWTRGNFFGYSIYITKKKKKDAYEVFEYYKAAAIIGEIKKYESKLNKQIITSQLDLLIDLYLMIEDDEIYYSKARGLNSNFGVFVPESELDNCIDNLIRTSKLK